ncbi:MAG: tyrosine-type recombinase/integrase [Bacilli bacterium]
MGNSLISMVKLIVRELEKTNLSYGTLKRHKACLNSIIKYCTAHNLKPIYSEEVIEGFLDEIKSLFENGEIAYELLRDQRKASYLIVQYKNTGAYNPKHLFHNSKYTLTNPYFIKFLKYEYQYYKETYHLSKGSNDGNFYTTKKFCFYLESIGFKNFQNLTINEVVNFISGIKKTNKGNIKSNIHQIKRILTYLDEKNIVHLNVNLSILKPQFIPPKEIVTFSKEEIIKILNTIDRNTSVGKRDYAIILLGITTGLRACDVVSLTLNDINWEKEYIKVVQSKTRKEIEVPLLANTSNALATYILKARPKVDSNTLFLTSRNPIKQMISYSLNNILRKYCKKVNVIKKKKGTFHSLRRSFCTWLSQDLTPVDLIAECVGHSNVYTAERYISVSPIMIQCCLDFTGIVPLQKGVKNV